MPDHAGGSAWLDSVLYDGALTDTDPLLDRAETIAPPFRGPGQRTTIRGREVDPSMTRG